MSSRKPGYVIGVILLSVVLSSPQALLAVTMGWFAYSNRTLPLPGTVGIHPPLRFSSQIKYQSFWHDGFVEIRWRQTSTGSYEFSVSSFDPETGEVHPLNLPLSGRNGFRQFGIGDRIWFVEQISKDTLEVVDGTLQKSTFVMPPDFVEDWQLFLWNGVPAFVEATPSCVKVSTLQDGKWNLSGNLVLPDFSRECQLGGIPINLDLGKSTIQIIESKTGAHLFLHADGLILYRKGMDVRMEISPEPVSESLAVDNDGGADADKTVTKNDEANSVNRDSTSDADLMGWTLVRNRPSFPDRGNQCTHGLLIDGQPAALIVDDISAACPTGHYYRFDGTTWNEINSLPLIFGSRSFRVVTTQDGLRSYVVAMTSTGTAHFYAVESGGLRKTNARDRGENTALVQFFVYVALPVVTLGLGLLLGAGTWCLMWWFTKPGHEFGTQTVKLASLGWRGFARLIDLSVICLIILGIGWLMTRGFDWLTLVEAVNLRIDHPVVGVARRIVILLAASLVAAVSMMLITQAVWGVTPGKWLCRLRTVRTSLRPCGFAASLAREIVFFVDCCNFLCWTPGILSVALTDNRQRLGDLVADTIVVEARSLVPASQTTL